MRTALVKNEQDALTELKEALSKRYGLLWMKLIGSKARGDYDEESDIDLVIVLDRLDWQTERDVYELCFSVGLKHDVVLSPIVYSREETEDSLTRATPFYRTVETEGVLV